MSEPLPASCDLMLFGALGNLARKKLFPALYQLDRAGLLAENSRILAIARRDLSLEEMRAGLIENLKAAVADDEFDPELAASFAARVDYQLLDFTDTAAFSELNSWRNSENHLIVYMATPPAMYGEIARNLKDQSCCTARTRVVVEKPIGHDLASSKVINDALAEVYDESQLFRIDHYLGKETVQNLIALRFANNLFASQWDQNHISHVEITVAESTGIDGRWGYFDKAGQVRDMIQNHLLQLLCLIAMDPPADLSADSIRDEKVKILKALKRITPDMMGQYVVRGQYAAGASNGKVVPGYLEEDGADKASLTETFVALKVEIDNWRWSGVPFYIRTGKRMPEKMAQIIIHFKPAPHYIFDPDQKHLANNKLIIRLQPDEGMALKILTKEHGLDKGMRLRQGPLELTFSETFGAERIPDAYERLLWEVMRGSQYLFVRRDEVEHAWRWVDQIIQNWHDLGEPPKRYAAGTWGPVASIALITRDGRSWYEDV
ncbi:MAG: glucose-6-phosphate dehydrogenase [Gammaproteobacteria bacterium]|uniref:Glucose-6-phosphate 1-dehydrogenase n=1 Tax=Marinobacter litoralis TaxID=187981 RepID=A0A3M2RLD9_9GAMM|nr:glucose-6-phosphate dehydrogenase [Marinobacter litoralis]MBR9870168.1 glucose-6-phosphate dehydrogenase [Gammaproteobacteria bacterium]RMJ05992.1 Glucose-6-phosphate 1-dehydrogenase [Marinobacter litoralis]